MQVLILHGIQAESGAHWMRWLAHALTERNHHVIMPQLPGSQHPERFDWLSFVKEVTDCVDTSKLVIIAHSLGVVTALDLIEQSPKKVFGLVSVSGFARDYGSELNSYFMKEKEIDFLRVRQNVLHKAVFYGDNDPYVSQAALEALANELDVIPTIISMGGHLNTDSGYTQFPEVLSLCDIFNTKLTKSKKTR